MYQKEQIIAGIMLYLKKELLPMLPDSIRMVAGAVLIHNTLRINELCNALANNGWGAALGIFGADGMVDLDKWSGEIKSSIRDFCDGRITIKIPMAQPIYFKEGDIDTVKRYIKGEL